MLRNLLATTLAISSMLLTVLTAHADTYNVNSTIVAGEVFGTIETDGTIGVLTAVNITDWSLELTIGASSFTLLGPLSGDNSAMGVTSGGFTATLTELLFDYSSGGYVLFQNPVLFSGTNFWALDSDGSATGLLSSESIAVGGAGNHNVSRSGIVSVATTVPEPSSLFVLGIGMAAIMHRRRRTPIGR